MKGILMKDSVTDTLKISIIYIDETISLELKLQKVMKCNFFWILETSTWKVHWLNRKLCVRKVFSRESDYIHKCCPYVIKSPLTAKIQSFHFTTILITMLKHNLNIDWRNHLTVFELKPKLLHHAWQLLMISN